MTNPFNQKSFEHGSIKFAVNAKPVSMQNKGDDKLRFKNEVQKLTGKSEFIISGTCWVAIDYYCKHINRQKNPGVYDIDNIVKPILDSLVGQNGILLDDVLVDRVTVNWIDTHLDDYFEVEIEYPDLLYLPKSSLVIYKSKSGWCFPYMSIKSPNSETEKFIQLVFEIWNSIKTEDDYYKMVDSLPIQNFIYYSKIKDRGYTFVEISEPLQELESSESNMQKTG